MFRGDIEKFINDSVLIGTTTSYEKFDPFFQDPPEEDYFLLKNNEQFMFLMYLRGDDIFFCFFKQDDSFFKHIDIIDYTESHDHIWNKKLGYKILSKLKQDIILDKKDLQKLKDKLNLI